MIDFPSRSYMTVKMQQTFQMNFTVMDLKENNQQALFFDKPKGNFPMK